jgi:hypothetical protein
MSALYRNSQSMMNYPRQPVGIQSMLRCAEEGWRINSSLTNQMRSKQPLA